MEFPGSLHPLEEVTGWYLALCSAIRVGVAWFVGGWLGDREAVKTQSEKAHVKGVSSGHFFSL